MNRNIAVVVLVLAVVLGGYIFWSQNAPPTSEVPTNDEVATQEADTSATDASATDPAAGVVVTDMVLGQADAPVTIVEYASFTCPHCQRFHEDVFPLIKANYIDTGKVRFVMRDVYFDRYGLWAAMVARCEGPQKFFGTVDLIFKRQQEWTSSGDDAAVAASLKNFGVAVGMEPDSIDACLNDGDKAQALVEEFQRNSERDQISSTPSFIINGASQANTSYGEFSRIIDGLLAE